MKTIFIAIIVLLTNVGDVMALSIEKQLIRDEGLRLTVYKDHLGKPTVGIGHLVTTKDKLRVGQTISKSRALSFFREDIKVAQRDARQFAGADTFKKLSKNTQNVLVNMAFNLGSTRLNKFKELKKAVKAGDYKKMAAEMKDSRWYKQVPNRAQRLISVINEEALLEETGEGDIRIPAYTRADGVFVPAHTRKRASK